MARKSANSKKYMVSNPQIRKMPQLRKVQKNLVRKFANLRFAELTCGPPPLETDQMDGESVKKEKVHELHIAL